MAKVFVSYSRKDIEFAKRLTAALQKDNLDFWIDWEGIPPTVDWWREIEKGIEEADVFIFLISPDSAQSKICGKEIDTAVKNAKRIIPLVTRDIKGDEAPTQLSHLNWIFVRESDDFDTAVKKLMTAIQTDYEWAATHRRLQVKALDWERNNKDNGFLLRGADLLDAEQDLATNTSKDPHPTDLQREYVLASRKATDRQRRILTSISIAGVIALAALAVFGIAKAIQATASATEANNQAAIAQAASTLASNNAEIAKKNEQSAVQQATIAHAGELSALALLGEYKHFDLSLLFAIEASKTLTNPRTRGTLLNLSVSHPHLQNYIFGHTKPVSSLAFSSDGHRLASASSDGSILLWNIADLAASSKFITLKHDSATCVAFSPNGKQLASGSINHSIILWDINDPATPKELATLPGSTSSLIFGQDGKYLISENNIWDISNAVKPFQVSQLPGHVYALSPDGKRLALEEEGKISILDISKPGEPFKLSSIPPYSNGARVSFSFDGKQLASGGFKAALILWDISNPEKPYQFPIPIDIPEYYLNDTSAIFSPDGRYLASTKTDNVIKLWDISNPASPVQLATLLGHRTSVSTLAFSSDSKQLASGSEDGSIILWNVDDWAVKSHLVTFASSDYPVLNVTYSPDGKQLVSNIGFSSIILWDIHDPFAPRKLESLPIDIDDNLAFSSDGKSILSTNSDGYFEWSAVGSSTPARLDTFPFPLNGTTTRRLATNGEILLLYKDNRVTLWDISNLSAPSLKGTLPASILQLNHVVLSRNGNLLAGSDNSNAILLWDITDLAIPLQIGMLSGHNGEISSIAFSHDDKILASGSVDNSIILWDISMPTAPLQIATLAGPAARPGQSIDPFSSIAFSPNTMQLATAGFYGITLWDIDTESLAKNACQRAGRNFTRAEWAQYFPDEEYRKTCEQWPLESASTPTLTP